MFAKFGMNIIPLEIKQIDTQNFVFRRPHTLV